MNTRSPSVPPGKKHTTAILGEAEAPTCVVKHGEITWNITEIKNMLKAGFFKEGRPYLLFFSLSIFLSSMSFHHQHFKSVHLEARVRFLSFIPHLHQHPVHQREGVVIKDITAETLIATLL